MPETPQQKADNERIRRQTLADKQAASKKHGKVMDEVASGGGGSTSCLGLLILLAGTPLAAFAMERFIHLG
jgi:hypothetical protein